MKTFKYLTLIMILVVSAAYAVAPKFHFGDKVKIIKGFYSNCTGTLTDYSINLEDTITYTLEDVSCPVKSDKSLTALAVEEDNLKKL